MKRAGQPYLKPGEKRALEQSENEPPQKKKRGRPAGSKNKPKTDDAVTKPKKSLRRRAEESAATDWIEDDFFADSADNMLTSS